MTWAQIRREILRWAGYTIADIIHIFSPTRAIRFAQRIPPARVSEAEQNNQ